jgi:GMP synthase-like glutamine amidotransferase
MRAHVFQHVPFEGPGSIADWLQARGARTAFTHFHAGDALPALAEVDLLIVLGGPMSVNDEASLPWLADEKRFIAEAIAAGKAVVGICLGAQLIATALGARVYPALNKEIGWFDIVSRPALQQDSALLPLPETLRVFHWHGETFSMPEGAVRLAGSSGCANQVFQYGPRVMALQCHLETTPDSAAAIVAGSADDLAQAQGGRFVQDAAAILGEPQATFEQMHAVMRRVLDHVTRP